MQTSDNNFDQLRRLAETILRSKNEKADATPFRAMEELLNEVQVYQIELELQNEDLRQTQEKLVASQGEFQELFDFAPVAYLILDVKGSIFKANLTAAEQFGSAIADLHGTQLADRVAPEDRDKFHLYRRLLLNSQLPQVAELQLMNHNGKRFHARLESTSKPASSENHTFRIAVSDISLAKSYEQRLLNYTEELEAQVEERTHALIEREHNEHEQRIFAEAMLDVVKGLNSTLDLGQVLEQILANLERVLPFNSANIILIENRVGQIRKWRGERASRLSTSEEPKIVLDHFPIYQQILDTQEIVLINDVEHEESIEFSLPDVEPGTKAYLGIPILSEGALLGILNIHKSQPHFFNHDQFDRLEAFAAQSAIAIKNARSHQNGKRVAVLEERQRFARDLHDAVSQNLFSLTLFAESLSRMNNLGNEKIVERTAQIITLAKSAQAEMRLLLMELRPLDMEKIRLNELLFQLVTGFKGKKDHPIHLAIEPIPVLIGSAKTALFRIAQESLNNIVKYANAQNASIDLKMQGSCVLLSIQDDGQGFDVTSSLGAGHGLTIMRERAEEIGAIFTIESKTGYGTKIDVMLPVSNEDTPE